jgi:hypothetical protein
VAKNFHPLKHLPRLTLVDLLLGQGLSAATVLWHELAGEGRERAADEAEGLVDLIVAALAQLDAVQNAVRGKKGNSA